MALVPNPIPRPVFQGPTPPWVECLETWSEEHDQPRLLNGDIRILQNPETTLFKGTVALPKIFLTLLRCRPIFLEPYTTNNLHMVTPRNS